MIALQLEWCYGSDMAGGAVSLVFERLGMDGVNTVNLAGWARVWEKFFEEKFSLLSVC